MQILKKKYYVVMKNIYFKRGMRRGGNNPYPQRADSPLLPLCATKAGRKNLNKFKKYTSFSLLR
jgi:hypothetical protein